MGWCNKVKQSKKRPLYIRYAGPILLETPILNKGSAFTAPERRKFNLDGLLPISIETIDDQEVELTMYYLPI